jgi:hypothetical protein
MVGEVTTRALALLLVAAGATSCCGDTSSDRGVAANPDTEDAGGAPDSEATPDAPGFESQAWRASPDYGDEGRPWVVNRAVHGTGATDMFVVGSFGWGIEIDFCFVDHLVGDGWEPVLESYSCPSSVWAASPSLVFGVGGGGVVVRIEVAEATSQEFVANMSLIGVWGWSEDNVLAVGIGGTIVHYDGEDWTTEESGTGANLEAVWGSDPDNVFAVGDGGVILTRAAGVWSTMESGTSLELNDVWGSGPSDVYAVGGRDGDPGHVILHYDGTRWSIVHTGDERVSALLGVSGRSASDVCAVGAYRDPTGTAHALVLQFDGSAWRDLPVDMEAFLWDVWPIGADAYLVVGPDDTLATVPY